MTDDDIRGALVRADYLLGEYVKLVKPVAEELAHRKSMALYNEPGMYTGNLGCWENGIDTLCLHGTDKLEGRLARDRNAEYRKYAELVEKYTSEADNSAEALEELQHQLSKQEWERRYDYQEALEKEFTTGLTHVRIDTA